MPLDQPLLIIDTQPVVECEPEVFDRLERPDPQHLLLEGPYEPFRDSIAFWGSHECRTRCHPEKPELGLKVITHVLTAMIMPHLHALSAPMI